MAEPGSLPTGDESRPGECTQALADGLMSLLGPAVQAAENGALALMRSQRDLNVQLDTVSVGVSLLFCCFYAFFFLRAREI